MTLQSKWNANITITTPTTESSANDEYGQPIYDTIEKTVRGYIEKQSSATDRADRNTSTNVWILLVDPFTTVDKQSIITWTYDGESHTAYPLGDPIKKWRGRRASHYEIQLSEIVG